MSTISVSRPGSRAGVISNRLAGDPAYQAFWLLRIAFTAAPILFGIDKFANLMVNWEVPGALDPGPEPVYD